VQKVMSSKDNHTKI